MLEGGQVTYPKATLEKYEFSEKPLSVLTGSFDLVANFKVGFKGTGLIQVTANVLAPDGRTIRSTTILVRSTAYNKIALLITALAALILVGLWARRIFVRPAS